ncbi:MAG: type II toxin-antitoxin system VapC family toxin [Acidobacteria bacterium]|nr:type II toxin-antitoxin system VapC family toxin [Acidobacteriota bacterium]
MKFWDTSALLPLFIDEPATEACRSLVASDPVIIVWEATSVEMLSALARLRRESTGFDDLWPSVRQEMLERWTTWSRVADWPKVSRRAQRLVSVHPLKAADALQLAAALVACEDQPHELPIVTRDRPLAHAARLEGFPTITPQ